MRRASPIRLTIYGEDGAIAVVALDAVRAMRLAARLIAAALPGFSR
jgi:hypothetical protein